MLNSLTITISPQQWLIISARVFWKIVDVNLKKNPTYKYFTDPIEKLKETENSKWGILLRIRGIKLD